MKSHSDAKILFLFLYFEQRFVFNFNIRGDIKGAHRLISKFTYTKFIFLYVLYSNQQIMLVIPTCNKLFLFTLNNKENKVNCKLIFGKIFCCQFYLMPSFLEKQNIQNIKKWNRYWKTFFI